MTRYVRLSELLLGVKGAALLKSDAHPMFVSILGQALFPVGRGFTFVRNHPHQVSRCLAAFRSAGLSALECDEREMERRFDEGLLAGAAEAAAAIANGMPTALVWTLET